MGRHDAVLRRPDDMNAPSSHVLRTASEAEAAVETARALGLAPNPVRIKSWDNVLAVRMIAAVGVAHDDPIVDLGCRSGILLTWLDQLGYRNLFGCDLRTPLPPLRSAFTSGLWRTVIAGTQAYLRHRRRMITAPVEDTGLPGGHFAAVASMSVIEHGVDLRRFFDESARLLRPGGLLIVSTDYWRTPIDVGPLRRFAASHGTDRIFDQRAVHELCDIARRVGFDAPAIPDPDSAQPVVTSSGFSYTFLLLAFRRGAA
jgi:SAM-dependent methyltransferase